MAQVVIADAGPLIALAKVDGLHVLERLFGGVAVPAVVQTECLARSCQDSQRIQQAIQAEILQVVAQNEEMAVPALPRSLGEGEKEAIRLALRHQDSLLIMDDRLARKQAARLGLAFIGTVRLLDIAQQRGIIEDAAQLIETMRNTGYRISADVLARVRR
ncbi:MAG: DUF3368 domain-containing protein [Betaproteobacteria bacterium]|nr:DUF3368 domain-containing protein [Betaproteobacteria bacterium]